ncbi:MAG: RtcB family protein [Gemmatimonadota bacterium]|nr:RtcB family protein [Gemmatimonadota bacterium]MDH3423803.1 RtcB family protein [Gemmatimonadota bacterium]
MTRTTHSPVAAAARRISEDVYEIPARAFPGMRVAARVYADDELWDQISGDRSLEQLVNVAKLPGVVDPVYAMPDAHEGYGFPVGGVAAFREGDGIISPGGVGYDINCGVRLLLSNRSAGDVADLLEPLVHELSRSIPAGAGRGGKLVLDDDELDQVFTTGCAYLYERGMATEHDLAHTESGGCLGGADPAGISARARARGRGQLGTMGSGNHFVEVERVEHIFDQAAADALGLRPDGVALLIHTGSRGLGHQVCTDYVARMDRAMSSYDFVLPDRQLACAPLGSEAGQAYLGAMAAAANYAWCNRQVITHLARRVVQRVLGQDAELRLVYDVAHNVAKLEHHQGELVCVHRKGATRAFGPSHEETPEAYAGVGQPVFIPGSMGTGSYVLVGQDVAGQRSFGSACHGAGRRMSRGQARRTRSGREVKTELAERGIVVRCPSLKELAEEAPYAYKDVDRVVQVVERVGLARRVARLAAMGVVKG